MVKELQHHCNRKTAKLKWKREDEIYLLKHAPYQTVDQLMAYFKCDEGRIRTKATLHGIKLVRKGQQPKPYPEGFNDGL